MKSRVSRALSAACLIAAAVCPAFPRAQSPADCSVGGTIAAGGTPLPGVVVSITGADGQTIDVTSTAPDGSYVLRFRSASAGRATLKAELVAFAPIVRELNPDSCPQLVDLAMTLASRAPRTASAAPAAAATPLASRAVGGRGRGAAPAQQFQSLELVADQAGLARPDAGDSNGGANGSDTATQLLLPPGF